MSDCTLNGAEVLHGEVKEPYSGACVAEVRIDADAKPTSAASLVLLSATYQMTVVADPVDSTLTLSGEDAGFFTARLVAGAGGLQKAVQPQEWAQGAVVSQVLTYILQAGGESQAADIDPQLLGTALSQWSVTAGTVGGALAALVDYLAVSMPGLIWRIRRDGLVWIGVPAPAQVAPPDYIVTAPGPEAGQALWDLNDATVQVDQIIDGLTIRQVVYSWDASELRALVTFAPGPVNALWQLFAQWQRRIGLDYYRQVSGRIAAQNDGTSCQFQPDSSSYSPLRKAALRFGLPDVTVEQVSGRGAAGWDGATPAAPTVRSYAPSTASAGTGGTTAGTITIGASAIPVPQHTIRGETFLQALIDNLNTDITTAYQALPPAATDPATAITLVNGIRVALLGLVASYTTFALTRAQYLTSILKGG